LRTCQCAIARAFGVERAFDQCVATLHYAMAAERSQRDFFFFARLKTHSCARGYIEAHSIGGVAIEFEFAVGFQKMEVAAYLDGAVAGIADD
jgi:hypothetical protein